MRSLATMTLASTALLASSAFVHSASASFTTYGVHSSWQAAVGGPTIARNSYDYFPPVAGLPVDHELWADVGVHFISPNPLITATLSPWGAVIANGPPNSLFQVKFDQPITALWFNVYTPSGGVGIYSGATFLGSVLAGIGGVTSTVAFDRISLTLGGGDAGLLQIEWNMVPGPGAALLLSIAAAMKPRSRRH